MRDYITGIFLGILFVAAIVYLFRYSKKNTLKNGTYDERQQLIRGRGYKYAFMSTIILQAIYGLIFDPFLSQYVATGAIMLIFIFAGIMVYAGYCIFHDAYAYVGQTNSKYIPLFLVVIAVNLLSFAVNFKHDLWTENGMLNSSLIVNCGVALTFTVLCICMIIKDRLNAKEED